MWNQFFGCCLQPSCSCCQRWQQGPKWLLQCPKEIYLWFDLLLIAGLTQQCSGCSTSSPCSACPVLYWQQKGWRLSKSSAQNAWAITNKICTTVEVIYWSQEIKLCQCKIASDKIPEMKNSRKAYKSAFVSPLTGSLWPKMPWWPIGWREFQHPAGFEPMSPNLFWFVLTAKP